MKSISYSNDYLSENSLLKGLKAGEHKALEQIFNTYYNLLLMTANNIVVDREKAKDIVQEVFEQLWIKRASLEIKTSLKPYLSRSVANRAINEYKRLRRRNEVNDDIEIIDSQNIHQQLEFEELNSEIQNAVNALPEKCRAVFIKSRVEGKSHQEISNELEISKKTIENQITKALKRIRIAIVNYNATTIFLIALLFCKG